MNPKVHPHCSINFTHHLYWFSID